MIYLVFVIAFLCGLVAYMDYNNRKERKALLNMIVAKDHSELVDLNLVDNSPKQEEEKEDLVPLEDLSEEEFRKATNG